MCERGTLTYLDAVTHAILYGSVKVEQFVHHLNDKCAKIDHTSPTQSSSAIADSNKQLSKMTLALSIKILTETRRRCWMFLEDNNFAAAARYA